MNWRFGMSTQCLYFDVEIVNISQFKIFLNILQVKKNLQCVT